MKTYLFSMETLKTIGQGALGAMTFGAYHQYTTNRIMELNNENMRIEQRYYIDKHNAEVNELREKLKKLEAKRWWN